MKKTLALAIISTLVVACSFAGQKPAPKPASQPATIKCAVQTGDTVNIKDATKKHMYADYKGNRYFFCCDGCPQAFKANPAKYAKNSHIKTPKGK